VEVVQEIYRGVRIQEIPDLYERLEKVSVDPLNWVTRYRDKYTGDIWEEAYESTGHGEVVVVRKLKA
jgi:TRAP-type mannitol/chloroaromatic compound transport system substrate-binding protein